MLLNGGNLVKPGKILPSFNGIFVSGKKNGIWTQGVIWVSTLYYRQPNPVFHLVQVWINPPRHNCPRSSLRFMRTCMSCWVFTTKKKILHFISHAHLPVMNGNNPKTRDRFRCTATGDMAREHRWSSCHLEEALPIEQSTLGSPSPRELPAHLLRTDKHSHFFPKMPFSVSVSHWK